MGSFNDKVALVTGGGSGLGEAIATSMAAKDVKVLLTDTNLEGATPLAKAI